MYLCIFVKIFISEPSEERENPEIEPDENISLSKMS